RCRSSRGGCGARLVSHVEEDNFTAKIAKTTKKARKGIQVTGRHASLLRNHVGSHFHAWRKNENTIGSVGLGSRCEIRRNSNAPQSCARYVGRYNSELVR